MPFAVKTINILVVDWILVVASRASQLISDQRFDIVFQIGREPDEDGLDHFDPKATTMLGEHPWDQNIVLPLMYSIPM